MIKLVNRTFFYIKLAKTYLEPDIGVKEQVAQIYFKQLMSAIEFIHEKGIAHRDIKPENILLDSDGNLKVCDFGLSSLYRVRKRIQRNVDGKIIEDEVCKERKLQSVVGSPPYIAPEVISGALYDGPKVDIWSCGVVLFVLLAGNTPWDIPNLSSPEFKEYLSDGSATNEYWNKLSPLTKGLCKNVIKI